MTTSIAFIGLGAMGSRMAANLIDAGHSLRLFNRTAARCEPLQARGAVVCASPAEAAQGAQFVISMVADDVASHDVMLGEHGVIPVFSGQAILDCSTNSPTFAQQAAQAAAARGLAYLDAPVSGSLAQAHGRELVFMVGGPAAAFEAAQPLFAAMGRQATRLGESGSGASVKLVNNMLSGITNAALAEAVRMLEAAGIDPMQALPVLAEGAAGSRLMRTKIPKLATREFSPQFQLALMDKDLRYLLEWAGRMDCPLPVATAARMQMQAARRAGLGDQDVSAVIRALG
jgi:3-hydroxyisobutyrate dehydrogenase